MELARLAPRTTAVDACADQLRRRILTGAIAAGARLPPERTLAEQLGVNRVTVRSALVRLATEGLLAARQGSGHVVRDFQSVAGPALLPDLAALAREHGDLVPIARDLLLVRRALARAVLDRVVDEPLMPAALASVRKAVSRFAEAARRGASPGELVPLDLAVQAALLSGAGPVLRLFTNAVGDVLAQLPELAAALYVEPEGNVAGYEALLAFLRGPVRGGVELLLGVLAERDAATLALLGRRSGERARRRAPGESPAPRRTPASKGRPS